MSKDPDLKLSEVAAMLSIPLRAARDLRCKGAFPNAYNVSGYNGPAARKIWRVPVADVEAFKRQRRAA